MVSTTLKPQNLVQNRNSKTHLTNHYFGVRCGENLSEVVKATRRDTNPHSHFQYNKFYKNIQQMLKERKKGIFLMTTK